MDNQYDAQNQDVIAATKYPASFKIFIGILITTTVIYSLATVLSYNNADVKYAMMLSLIQLIAFGFAIAGAFIGMRFQTEIRKVKMLNRIGVAGNLIFFLFTLGMMIFALTLRM